MNNTEELKPCPFCGGEARIVEVGAAHVVGCTNCAEKYWRYGGRSDAIEFWNRRVCVSQKPCEFVYERNTDISFPPYNFNNR